MSLKNTSVWPKVAIHQKQALDFLGSKTAEFSKNCAKILYFFAKKIQMKKITYQIVRFMKYFLGPKNGNFVIVFIKYTYFCDRDKSPKDDFIWP